jgi:hypothetical protein
MSIVGRCLVGSFLVSTRCLRSVKGSGGGRIAEGEMGDGMVFGFSPAFKRVLQVERCTTTIWSCMDVPIWVERYMY